MGEIGHRLDGGVDALVDAVELAPARLGQAHVERLQLAERAFLGAAAAEIDPAVGHRGRVRRRRRRRPSAALVSEAWPRLAKAAPNRAAATAAKANDLNMTIPVPLLGPRIAAAHWPVRKKNRAILSYLPRRKPRFFLTLTGSSRSIDANLLRTAQALAPRNLAAGVDGDATPSGGQGIARLTKIYLRLSLIEDIS